MSQHPTHYNLLMSGNELAWEGQTWTISYDRVFEHTLDSVKQPFAALDQPALAALMSLPTLFAYERIWEKPARVGRITDIARRQEGFAITYVLDEDVAPVPFENFLELLEDLDIGAKREVHRSHWAVKNVDLAKVLHRAGLIPAPSLIQVTPAPRVFISYSWDSSEHQAWVEQFARALRDHGVDVILDKWHLRLGQDLAHFMAESVRNSDRVLLVCTQAYVRKARERRGGVGYEQMLLTPEIMREVNTTKFIPIVRQSASPPELPYEVAGRLYVDLSDGPQYQVALQTLIRDLHNMGVALPPLGPPPPRSA